MTAIESANGAGFMRQQLAEGNPRVLRTMVTTCANAVISAEADTICGAEYGQHSDERTNRRSGDRARKWDTRVGTVELQMPKLRQGNHFSTGCWERRVEQALVTVATSHLRRVDAAGREAGRTARRHQAVQEPGLGDGRPPRRSGSQLLQGEGTVLERPLDNFLVGRTWSLVEQEIRNMGVLSSLTRSSIALLASSSEVCGSRAWRMRSKHRALPLDQMPPALSLGNPYGEGLALQAIGETARLARTPGAPPSVCAQGLGIFRSGDMKMRARRALTQLSAAYLQAGRATDAISAADDAEPALAAADDQAGRATL